MPIILLGAPPPDFWPSYVPGLSKALSIVDVSHIKVQSFGRSGNIKIVYCKRVLNAWLNIFWDIITSFIPNHEYIINLTFIYRKRAIITRSWFETTDLAPEFPCLVHELSVILTALDYKSHWKMGSKIYKPRLIMARVRYWIMVKKTFWFQKKVCLHL